MIVNKSKQNPLRGNRVAAKIIGMRLSTWVQYSWNLKTLPAEVAKLPARYTVEAATLDDRNLLLAAGSRSVSMEPAWSGDVAARVKLAEVILGTAFSGVEACLVSFNDGARLH